MFELKILVGFLVGTLIGMTGLGGGVLLLPILIYGLHVPAMLAVGSDGEALAMGHETMLRHKEAWKIGGI